MVDDLDLIKGSDVGLPAEMRTGVNVNIVWDFGESDALPSLRRGKGVEGWKI